MNWLAPNWIDRAIGAVAPGAGLRRARQRQMMAVLARAYEGAKLGRRTEGWVAAGTGANAEIAPAIARLRDRSRDLVRNNPYAAKAVTALVSNMVGTGLLPRARAATPELAAQADRLWSEFAAVADADGLTDFAGLQALIVRSLVESGEVLVRLRERRVEDGLPVPLAAAGARGRPPRQHEDRGAARRRLRPAGHRVRRPRPPARLLALSDASRRRPRRAGLASGAGRPRAAPLRAAAARAGARRAVVRPGDAEAPRPRRLRRGRAGAEEDRGLLRRLRHRRAGRGDPRQGADRGRRQPHRDLRARDDRVPRAGARREVRQSLRLGRLRRVHAAAAACHRRRRRAHLRAADRRPQPGQLLLDPGRAHRVPPADGGAAVAAPRPRPLPAGLAALRAGGAGRGQAARRRHRRRLDRAALRGGRSDEGHPGRHPRGARRGDDAEGGDRPPGLRAGAGAGRDRRDQRRARCARHHPRHRSPPVDPHRPGEAAHRRSRMPAKPPDPRHVAELPRVGRPAGADPGRRPADAGERRCRAAHRRAGLVDRRRGAPARSLDRQALRRGAVARGGARRPQPAERRRAAPQHPRRLGPARRDRRRRAGLDRPRGRGARRPRHGALLRPGRRRADLARRRLRHRPQRLGRLRGPQLRDHRDRRPAAGLARRRLAAARALRRADRRRRRRRLPRRREQPAQPASPPPIPAISCAAPRRPSPRSPP